MTTKQIAERSEELSEKIQVELPNSRKVSRIEKNALAKLEESKSIKVNNTATYNSAAEFALGLKTVEGSILELLNPHIDAAHKLHKGLTDTRKRLVDPLVKARMIVQGVMSAYDLEQRRLQDEKTRADAEKLRQAEIKQAQKEKDKERIAELKTTTVEDFIEEPAAPPTPKVAGIVSKKVIKWRLAKTGDISKIPRRFLCLDETAINAYVKANGLGTKIEGIEIFEDVQTQVRG